MIIPWKYVTTEVRIGDERLKVMKKMTVEIGSIFSK